MIGSISVVQYHGFVLCSDVLQLSTISRCGQLAVSHYDRKYQCCTISVICGFVLCLDVLQLSTFSRYRLFAVSHYDQKYQYCIVCPSYCVRMYSSQVQFQDTCNSQYYIMIGSTSIVQYQYFVVSYLFGCTLVKYNFKTIQLY